MKKLLDQFNRAQQTRTNQDDSVQKAAEALGKKSRARREKAGISLRTAARSLKISATYLSHLERGLRKGTTSLWASYHAKLTAWETL